MTSGVYDVYDVWIHGHIRIYLYACYAVKQVGPVLMSNHGMGQPTLSICLHEITKLLFYAGLDPGTVPYIRLGTSGGLGLEPGSVVITKQPLNGLLQSTYALNTLGERVERPSRLHGGLRKGLLAAAEADSGLSFPVVQGSTVAADCFYEEQGRLDGAICDYDLESKMQFLKQISQAGVVNFEMEATEFGMFTTRLGIPGAVVCTTLLDRLQGDTVDTPAEVMEEWNTRPAQVVLSFIQRHLHGTVGREEEKW